MLKLTVDGVEIQVEPGVNVLQACEQAGVEIPRFCYHERLSVAGNCRMCLVEIEKSPKPVASCAMSAADGMVIHTKTETVRRAREGVMEFLLINHPLDCPICDQGGECDLQDQAMGYGVDGSRFEENKRAVEEKNMGPLVKTRMTRCIHCTRCVRFVTEVAGVPEIGAIGRGEDMEITTYLEKALTSEMQGNVIDLCPVGALTSRPYAFTARPWELKKTETIDVMDALGSHIRVDTRGQEVMRVLPRIHEDINEEWISDKTRFIWDGLRSQRLDSPYIRVDDKLRPASWDEAFQLVAQKLKSTSAEKIAAIAGDLACTESMIALKDLAQAIGTPHTDCRQDGARLGGKGRASYLFNSGIAGVESADAVLIIGSDPRSEAPVLNARIRKRWLAGGLHVGVIGQAVDLTYEVQHLGSGTQTLQQLRDGSHSFAGVLRTADRPMIILGQGALKGKDGEAVLDTAIRIARDVGAVREDWNGFNVLHTAAARVGGLDAGFLPGPEGRDVEGILAGAAKGDVELVYLLGADEIDMSLLEKAFVVYQGTHGDAGAHAADVIFPGAAYTEKNALWVNTEGRVQAGRRALFAPGEAREDWAILRALSGFAGLPLPYDTLAALRTRMVEKNPVFAGVGERRVETDLAPGGTPAFQHDTAFELAVENFYFTNPVARASKVMAEAASATLPDHSGARRDYG